MTDIYVMLLTNINSIKNIISISKLQKSSKFNQKYSLKITIQLQIAQQSTGSQLQKIKYLNTLHVLRTCGLLKLGTLLGSKWSIELCKLYLKQTDNYIWLLNIIFYY